MSFQLVDGELHIGMPRIDDNNDKHEYLPSSTGCIDTGRERWHVQDEVCGTEQKPVKKGRPTSKKWQRYRKLSNDGKERAKRKSKETLFKTKMCE